ncbi:MAG TPA: hypothetical protein VNY70_01540 [Steroidobacteraceae bacterium]|nr:hypothetical protein [Steroidobacteraceae bacterium]
MQDERDALLLREFARSQRPLADAQFVRQVRERLQVFSASRLLAVALSGMIRAVFTGLSFGIVAPLRMRHAGLVALAALGLALWSIVRGSQ